MDKVHDKKHAILSLLPLLDALQEKQVPLEPFLSNYGIKLNSLSATTQIALATEFDVTADALQILNDPFLGLKLGQKFTITSYSLYAMLLLSAPNFKAMIDCAYTFQRLSLFFSDISVHYTGSCVEIRNHLPEIDDKCLRTFVSDRDFAGMASFLIEVIKDHPDMIISCGLARPEPPTQFVGLFNALLGKPPQFDQTYNWVRIPISVLNQTSKYSNALVHQLHRVQAQDVIRTLYSHTDDVTSQIQLILEGCSAYPYPSQPDIAIQLGVSESTLRRKLNKQGISYRKLLETHRSEKAKSLLLAGSIRLSDIAEKLGYADEATFAKAFKKWLQLTPKQYVLMETQRYKSAK